ncbi:MAG TPA: cbb3-type cytochrome c oxidase subunit I [Symbiobacteriaceae bacterium]
MGGVTGVLWGQMQLNMLVHNTLFVPEHFHSTVVAGTTVAFVGIAYYLVPLISRRPLAFLGLARLQPYVYSLGLAILTGSMMLAGKLGVPRRLWDVTYEEAVIPVTLFQHPRVEMVLAGVGIGAMVAVLGGEMFVMVMLGTVLSRRVAVRPDAGLRISMAMPMTGGSQDAGAGKGRSRSGA